MKWTLFILTSVLILSGIFSSTASAHVLITDQTKSKGAILHITPDDDPIAGQPATIYFDTQDQLATKNSSVNLEIINSSNQSATVETKIDGSLVTARYTFPTQGVYKLVFTIDNGSQSYTFEQSQRVARGVTTSALDKPDYAWAEIALVTSVSLFLVLLIVAFNRRKEILFRSKY